MDTACRGGPRDADTLPIQTSMEGRRRWLRLHWARFTLQSNSSASYPGKWTEASIENRRQSCHLHYPGVLAHVIVVLRGVILRALRRLPRHGTAQADRRDVRVYVRTIVKDGDAYVLKAGNEKYLLDSQKKAQKYNGKDVKITGTLDNAKNLIHVEKIKSSPSM